MTGISNQLSAMEAPDWSHCTEEELRVDLKAVGEWCAMEGALAAFEELSSHLAEDESEDKTE